MHRSDGSVTVHSECSAILQSNSAHSATRVRRSRVVRLSWSLRFVMQAAVSTMLASSSSGVTACLFIHFALHPAPHTKLYLAVQSQLDTCCSLNFFSPQWPILSPPIILTFPPESPCIRQVIFFPPLAERISPELLQTRWLNTQLDAPH